MYIGYFKKFYRTVSLQMHTTNRIVIPVTTM